MVVVLTTGGHFVVEDEAAQQSQHWRTSGGQAPSQALDKRRMHQS